MENNYKYEYFQVTAYLSINGSEPIEWVTDKVIDESSCQSLSLKISSWDELASNKFSKPYMIESVFKHKGKNRKFMPFYEYGACVKEWKTPDILVEINVVYKKIPCSIYDIIRLEDDRSIPYLVERGFNCINAN